MSARRVAVVSGGAGGIATACVRALHEVGRLFLLADASAGRVEATVELLAGEGIEAEAIACDASDRDQVEAVARRATELGAVDRLIHTAGIAPPGAGDPRRILEVNLLGTNHFLDAVGSLIAEGGVGVCVSSLAGHRGFTRRFDPVLRGSVEPTLITDLVGGVAHLSSPPLGAYALSKRYVILQCQRRSAEWGRRGARLVSVSPGLIADTRLGEEASSIHAGAYAKQSSLGRAGEASDVADAVFSLCSDRSRYVTGCDLLVDGGVLAYIDQHLPASDRDAWHELRG